MKKLLAAAIVACMSLAFSAEVGAQEEPLDTQRFKPYATSDGFLSQEASGTRFPVDPFTLGFWLGYGNKPFVIADPDNDLVNAIVGHQVSIDVTASYTFVDWFELGIHLPMAFLSGDDPDFPGLERQDAVSEFALGDIRLVPKFKLLDDRIDGIGLAATAELWVPSHTSDFYGGARNVVFVPRLIVDHVFGLSGFRLGGNMGARVREGTDYLNVKAASEFLTAIAFSWRMGNGRGPIELLAEAELAIGLAETDSEEIALEPLLGLNFYPSEEWIVTVGGGFGVLEGYGVPTFRVMAGFRWEPRFNDSDGDGLPDEPADDDGSGDDGSDDDGSGDDGSGGDGSGDGSDDEERERAIAEGRDACPDLPEDLDGIEDDDGCPEGDEDGDGVLDLFDACPDEDEVINGFEDDDGCPDEGPAKVIVEDGKLKILETIRFKPNSDELEDESEEILDQIALTIRSRSDIRRIRIEGHTDNTGSRELNMDLSRRRARTVRNYMVEKGIKPRRLESQGFGPDQPIATNDTEEGRAQNRRVEFIVVEK